MSLGDGASLDLRIPTVRPWRDWLVSYPAMPVTIALMVGIGVHRCVPVWPMRWAAAGAALFVIALLLRRRAWFFLPAICACFGFIGLALAQRSNYLFPANHVIHFTTESPRLCFARLYLPNEPRLRVGGFGQKLSIPARQATIAQLREIRTVDGQWTPVVGDALVQLAKPHPQLAAGETIEVVGFLERPGEAFNPGQFDWKRYYRDQRVVVSIQVRDPSNVTILSREPAPWLTTWQERVRQWLAAGFPHDRSLDLALTRALVLGDYDPELRDVKEQFRATGTSHHLAISGMHVAVVAGFVFLLLRLLKRSPSTCWWIGMSIVVLYGLLAAPSAPVWRSVLLFVVAGLCMVIHRPVLAVQLLALTVLVMLVFFPLDLFNAGFQLSFGTVLGLMLLSDLLFRRWTADQPIETRAERERAPIGLKIARHLDESILRGLATGLVAWAVSMPLVAMQFSQLNVWQVPCSILLSLPVTFTLLSGVIKIALTGLIPSLAPVLAWVTYQCSGSMRWMVALLAKLPWADVPLPSPPWWVAALCWISLVIAIVPWRYKSARMMSFLACVACFGWMLFAPYAMPAAPVKPAVGSLRFTLLAVGAGQTALIEPPGGKVSFFDIGSASLTDLNYNVVAPALRERAQTSIDTIALSHANTDHYSGAAEIAASYGVHDVLVGSGFEDLAKQNSFGQELLKQLKTLNRPPHVMHIGDRVPLGADTHIDILWPPEHGYVDNEGSMVIKLTHAGTTILFPGDIQDKAMEGLLKHPELLKADILVAPHHGSFESTTSRFVEAVSPQLILSSDDRTPTGKQREFDALCVKKGWKVLHTHEVGAITIQIDASGKWTVETFLKK